MARMPRNHLCPWPGCDSVLDLQRTLCFEHWQPLSADLRRRFNQLILLGDTNPEFVALVEEAKAASMASQGAN